MCKVHRMSDGHESVGKNQEKVDRKCRGEGGRGGLSEQAASEHRAGVSELCPYLGKNILERRNSKGKSPQMGATWRPVQLGPVSRGLAEMKSWWRGPIR